MPSMSSGQPRVWSGARHLTMCVALAAAAGCGSSPTAPTQPLVPQTLALVVTGPTVPALTPPASGTALGVTRFLAFGDSITCGTESAPVAQPFLEAVNCTPSNGYPERLLGLLRATVPAVQQSGLQVINRGSGGEGAVLQGEARLRRDLADLMAGPVDARPQALLLLMGVNDLASTTATPARVASSVASMADIGRAYGLGVIVATMPQTYPGLSPAGIPRDNASTRIVPFNAELTRLVTGVPDVSLLDVYEGFGGTAAQRLGLMGVDGLHPTPMGHERMAELFLTEIVRRFPVRRTLQ